MKTYLWVQIAGYTFALFVHFINAIDESRLETRRITESIRFVLALIYVVWSINLLCSL